MVQKDSLKKIVIICGPTASGKTALSVALAKRLGTEVISADSLYIYKGLNIGTAKPTKEEMQGVTHHLIDVVDPEDDFSVSDYERLSLPIINDLISKNKIPIVCGGTGFYINSIIYKLSYGNAKGSEEIRQKYASLLAEKGEDYIYNYLKCVDPETADKLHPHDVKRVIRALEIYEIYGKPKSEIKDDLTPRYDYKSFTVGFNRDSLYKRIDDRVNEMLGSGLIEEVKGLLSKGITLKNQCMQGIGYKEVANYLINNSSYDEMVEELKRNTRRYAKRQITFFKRDKRLVTIEPSDIDSMVQQVMNNL